MTCLASLRGARPVEELILVLGSSTATLRRCAPDGVQGPAGDEEEHIRSREYVRRLGGRAPPAPRPLRLQPGQSVVLIPSRARGGVGPRHSGWRREVRCRASVDPRSGAAGFSPSGNYQRLRDRDDRRRSKHRQERCLVPGSTAPTGPGARPGAPPGRRGGAEGAKEGRDARTSSGQAENANTRATIRTRIARLRRRGSHLAGNLAPSAMVRY